MRDWKKETLLLDCLSSLFLASSSILLLQPPLNPHVHSSGFQHRLKTNSSPGVLENTESDCDYRDEHLPDSQPFRLETAIGLQGPCPIGSVSLENLTNTGKIESKYVHVVIVK